MYPIQATVTLSNAAQLAAFNAFITGGGATVEPESVKPTFNPAPVKKDAEVKKPAATTASSPSGAEPQASAAPAQEKASAADAPERTVDDAKALTMKIVADKGRDTAVELLKKYGVPVAAKLAADQVGAFCADAEAVLAS